MTNVVRQSVSSRLSEMVKSKPQAVNIAESNIAVPTDQQARLSQTIQTHSGATIVNGVSNDSAFIDCDGFDRIAINFLNSGATANSITILWSNDGVSTHGMESIFPNTTDQYRISDTSIKSKYLRIRITNSHTAPITANAWVYQKA